MTISGRVAAGHQTDLSVPHTSATAVTNPQQLGGSTTAVTQLSGNGVTRKGTGLTLMDTTLRLSAVEDLGGGLRANFVFAMEGSREFRGAAFTRADSGIGLSGGFGEIGYLNTRSSDAMFSVTSPAINLPDGLYDSTGILGRTAIDTLNYRTPELAKGLRVTVSYVENNDGAINPPGTYTAPNYTAQNAKTYVVGASYTAGPLSLTVTHKTKPTNTTASGGTTPKANTEIFARYDLGVAAIALGYDGAERSGTAVAASAGTFASIANASAVTQNFTKAATGLSITVPMGAFSLGAQTFKRGTAKVTDFGALYSLSKRTSINASVGKKSGLADDNNGHFGTQHRVAVIHTF